MTSNQHQKPCH